MDRVRFPIASARPAPLQDGLGRAITYMRVSVTDRCDLRCVYCMTERMRFLPKAEILSFEELYRLCTLFIAHGVRRLRITGGEPLVRRGVLEFMRGVSRHLRTGELEELTLTTNGVALGEHAHALADMGVRRVNVSLDSLDRATVARISRRDVLPKILEGIDAAKAAGLAVKINIVALARDNRAEIPAIIQWAHEQGLDACLIETMPLGEIDEERIDQYVSLADIRRDLEAFWTLEETSQRPGAGPARYVRIRETGGRLGFITPLSHNFCDSCNRVRLTCTGRLFMCLGQDDHVDFREALRRGASEAELSQLYRQALAIKPKAHDFRIGPEAHPAVARHMSMTGG
jgi:cyclic pyranopterin phosphate synthase